MRGVSGHEEINARDLVRARRYSTVWQRYKLNAREEQIVNNIECRRTQSKLRDTSMSMYDDRVTTTRYVCASEAYGATISSETERAQ